jgi:opacity protein-like surface antigen
MKLLPNYMMNKCGRKILIALMGGFAFLSCCISTTLFAAPLYAGIEIGDNSAGALLGFQINQTYAVEMHYLELHSGTTHAGLTVDTATTEIGVVGIAYFPVKLRDVLPCNLFVKGGYERTNNTDTYSFPASVTFTVPYNDTISSQKNQFIFGGGAEYDYSKNLTGRTGVDFIGSNRMLSLSAIFKF